MEKCSITYYEIAGALITYTWNLENYSVISRSKSISSPHFSLGSDTKQKWSIQLWPKRQFGPCKLLAVGVKFESIDERLIPYEPKIYIMYRIILKDKNSDKVFGQSTCGSVENMKWKQIEVNDSRSDSLGLSSRLSRKILKHGDEVQISCKLRMYVMSAAGSWLSLRLNDEFSDVDICTENSVASRKFKAHKDILSGHSPVFSRMFDTNMSESVNNILEIPDFEEDIIEGMLYHVYGGTCCNFPELAPELLQIADKYDICSLKTKCEVKIADNLKVENAVSILLLADTHNAPELKRNAMQFINSHKGEVKETEHFPNLSAELTSELQNIVLIGNENKEEMQAGI